MIFKLIGKLIILPFKAIIYIFKLIGIPISSLYNQVKSERQYQTFKRKFISFKKGGMRRNDEIL